MDTIGNNIKNAVKNEMNLAMAEEIKQTINCDDGIDAYEK